MNVALRPAWAFRSIAVLDSVEVPPEVDCPLSGLTVFHDPVGRQHGRPRGIPQKVTPTVATMILSMKAEKKKKGAHIARELRLSRQTIYEGLTAYPYKVSPKRTRRAKPGRANPTPAPVEHLHPDFLHLHADADPLDAGV